MWRDGSGTFVYLSTTNHQSTDTLEYHLPMMPRTLAELIDGTAVEIVHESGVTDICNIVEDSRQVTHGSLFIARPGEVVDGRQFIIDAIRKGAVAVLSDRTAHVPQTVTCLAATNVAVAAAQLAERYYHHPSQSLFLVGVTGTNGKTTTAHLVHQMLAIGQTKCGLIGTVQIDDGVECQPASLTTPTSLESSKLLRTMVDAGCGACAMEVSSHALHQGRAAGLAFDVGIFTNLSGDHIDYHGSMDEYALAKAMLFKTLTTRGTAIVNMDDSHWQVMTKECPARIMRCSLLDSSADCFGEITRESAQGVDAILRGPWGSMTVHLPLIGRHNTMNALHAVAACYVVGMDNNRMCDALKRCTPPPGRLEPVAPTACPFAVFVDYAHTDDALDNVLRAVKPLVQAGSSLRVVFGCGGDRDRTKRPRMAQAAWRWADEVIVTSDNPRTEDPDVIIQEVLDGVPTSQQSATRAITDRREAIETAIAHAQPNDIVIIAGKGHEDYQIIGKAKRPFDDRQIAREAIARLHTSPKPLTASDRDTGSIARPLH